MDKVTNKKKFEDRIWDYSTISTFQTCRKKYYFQHLRHLRPHVKGTPLLFGGAIHEALDEYYLTGSMDKGIIKFRSEYETPEGDDLRSVETGIKLLTHYAIKYKDEPFKVASKPEEGFVFPVGDILFGGRLDLPVEWDGQLWIMEHKTTTRLTGNYFDQFELDKQMTGYIIATEEFFGGKRKCMGCIINAMEPWKEVQRKTARTKQPEDHFLRKPLTRSDAIKERFKLNVQRLVRDIKWCEDNDEFQEAEKKEVCYYYNRACAFLQLCKYGEDERIIKRDYVIDPWEPYQQKSEVKKNETMS